MIPNFPEFKKLELSDKDEIESFTKKFPPYSDFNFMSMFSWDIKGDMRVSLLNNNLVVRFNDYITSKPFYSFLGDNDVNETAEKIIEYSKLFGGGDELKLVPEVAIKDLDKSKFLIIEESDQFDYIYDLGVLAEMQGGHFSNKRTAISKLKRNFPSINIRLLNIRDNEVKKEIININTLWLEQKKENDPFFDIKNELSAVERFLSGDFLDNLFTCGVFIGNELVAYSISEKLSNSFAMSHFSKASTLHRGIYDYLMQENSILFLPKGIKYLNYEQDLGLTGLRESKKNFSTGIFLRKYRVMLK